MRWVRVVKVGYTSTMPYKLLHNNQLRVIKPLAREVVRIRMRWWAHAEWAARVAGVESGGRIGGSGPGDIRSRQAR